VAPLLKLEFRHWHNFWQYIETPLRRGKNKWHNLFLFSSFPKLSLHLCHVQSALIPSSRYWLVLLFKEDCFVGLGFDWHFQKNWLILWVQVWVWFFKFLDPFILVQAHFFRFEGLLWALFENQFRCHVHYVHTLQDWINDFFTVHSPLDVKSVIKWKSMWHRRWHAMLNRWYLNVKWMLA
jgi:hypothetical protein